MKWFIIIPLIVLGISGLCLLATAANSLRIVVDRKIFLRAIDEVESGGRDAARGAAGERGRYQLTQRVWSQHTASPFKHAHRRDLAHAVAEQHFDWIVNQLEMAGWPADVESVALAWNAGLTATINCRTPASSQDYAQRVCNLYADMLKAGGAK